MKKKILMVYPEFPVTYWSMKHSLSFIKKKSSLIPLGLLTVAALLPEDYDVTLIDMNVNKLRTKDIEEADMVFISAMIVQKNSFDEVVALCNRLNVPVVAGGPYPTSSHEKISGVDHFVLHEAEITLPPFIRDYEKGTPKPIYSTNEKPDITKTPPPRFDLIDFRDYNNIALQNSRGCPFNCEFCDIIELFGRVPRFKD
ncbi:MAG TPA: cobalamin-dependent protein, partial [Spirochaetota bacterium]|nr:cobalamin-dependent protein [Spirochaetota bacterium]